MSPTSGGSKKNKAGTNDELVAVGATREVHGRCGMTGLWIAGRVVLSMCVVRWALVENRNIRNKSGGGKMPFICGVGGTCLYRLSVGFIERYRSQLLTRIRHAMKEMG
jgi:hypothetical protein